MSNYVKCTRCNKEKPEDSFGLKHNGQRYKYCDRCREKNRKTPKNTTPSTDKVPDKVPDNEEDEIVEYDEDKVIDCINAMIEMGELKYEDVEKMTEEQILDIYENKLNL